MVLCIWRIHMRKQRKKFWGENMVRMRMRMGMRIRTEPAPCTKLMPRSRKPFRRKSLHTKFFWFSSFSTYMFFIKKKYVADIDASIQVHHLAPSPRMFVRNGMSLSSLIGAASTATVDLRQSYWLNGLVPIPIPSMEKISNFELNMFPYSWKEVCLKQSAWKATNNLVPKIWWMDLSCMHLFPFWACYTVIFAAFNPRRCCPCSAHIRTCDGVTDRKNGTDGFRAIS